MLPFALGCLFGACAILGGVRCASSPSPRESADQEIDDLVLGKVAGREFTVSDMKKKIHWQFRAVGEGMGFGTVKQHREIFEDAIDQLALVAFGERKGLQKEQEFKDILELSRRYVLAERVMQKEVRDKEVPTEEEIQSYFEQNQGDFKIPVRVQIAHVLARTKADAERARARVLRGESVGAVAREMSVDEPSKRNGGVLGWVTATSGAGHLGVVPAINAAAVQLKKGEVSEPVPVGEQWSVIYAIDRTEVQPRSLDAEVRGQILRRVQTRKHNELYDALMARLKKDYGVELMADNWARYARTLLSEDDLFAGAQQETDPAVKVGYYEEVVRRYGDSPRAPQAQFMVGFVRADEQREYRKAREAFEAFLRDYPDHDLAASARWMIENMDKPNPDPRELGSIRSRAGAP